MQICAACSSVCRVTRRYYCHRLRCLRAAPRRYAARKQIFLLCRVCQRRRRCASPLLLDARRFILPPARMMRALLFTRRSAALTLMPAPRVRR